MQRTLSIWEICLKILSNIINCNIKLRNPNGYLNTDNNVHMDNLPSLNNSKLETSFNNISNIMPKRNNNTNNINNNSMKAKPKTEAKLWEDKREKVFKILIFK